MEIGNRVKLIRQQKNLSQGDIEKRSGLLRCYVSRVENGHTTPSIETLETLARALDAPLYQLFYDGEGPLRPAAQFLEADGFGSSVGEARTLKRFRRLLGLMTARDVNLLLRMAVHMATTRGHAKSVTQ
ncbi:MAG TPA: helix-turn-helix domain-containing protein [Candidatus Acidoferrales bacterium]